MAQIVSASSFSRSFTASSTVAMISLLDSVLEVIEKLRPFARRSVSIWQDRFLDLVYLVLTTAWYTFNSQFYQQTDGVALGGPASSTTTEIYMQAYEHTAITTALHPPKVWE